MIIEAGRAVALLLLIVGFAAYAILLPLSKKGKISIRKLAAIDAIDEAVGRAAETGGAVYFTGGECTLADEVTAQIMAGANILGYIGGLVAEKGVNLIATAPWPDIRILFDEVLRQSFQLENKLDYYDEQCEIRFSGGGSRVYASSCMASIETGGVTSAILMGPFFSETILLTSSMMRAKTFNVIGCSEYYQLPYVLLVADHAMIGEELFAAGAYISKEYQSISTICAEDIIRGLFLSILLLGIIAKSLGSNWVINILSL